MPKQHIDIWAPSILETGGIQEYGRVFIKTLIELNYDNLRVFLRNDNKRSTEHDWLQKTSVFPTVSTNKYTQIIFFIGNVIFRILKRKPNLIIVTHPHFAKFAAIISKYFGIPYWTIIYGEEVWDLHKKLDIWGISNSEKIISISKLTAERILQQLPDLTNKISILPCTANFEKYTIKNEKPEYLLRHHNLTKDEKIILTVGRLDPSQQYKGHDAIISQLSKIALTVGKIKYLIVGSGGDKVRLEKLVDSFNVSHMVIFVGRVKDEEISDYYNLCDVFAMPSSGEGFGIVFLEALACGKPAIGGKDDGAKDALLEGECGILIDPKNAEEVANSISEILTKNPKHQKLYNSENLRSRAIEAFGEKSFINRLSILLNNLDCK
ncbi:MAG: glycosyltransferase family 4 protein [Proteobacteria bacterium]|nr:glycosyltransferase family 4 protein [Pseudomonadota bacterium]